MGGLGIPGLPIEVSIPSAPTKVLCLFNMVTPEELQDIEEYEGRCYTKIYHTRFVKTVLIRYADIKRTVLTLFL